MLPPCLLLLALPAPSCLRLQLLQWRHGSPTQAAAGYPCLNQQQQQLLVLLLPVACWLWVWLLPLLTLQLLQLLLLPLGSCLVPSQGLQHPAQGLPC